VLAEFRRYDPNLKKMFHSTYAMEDPHHADNLAYCQVQALKIYDWLEDNVLNSRKKDTDSFVLTDVKNKFPTISTQLLEMTLQILLSTGKISLFSPDHNTDSAAVGGNHRSRVIQYYLSRGAGAEIIEKKKQQEQLAELAEQYQAEIDRQNRRKAQREKQELEAEKMQALPRKGSASSASSDSARTSEKENSRNEQNAKKLKPVAIASSVAAPAPAPAPFDSNSPIRTYTDTRIVPVCDVSKQVLADVTEILQMSSESSEGGAVEIGDIFEQIQARGVSRETLYKSLEYLTELNRIMVDWDDADKDQKSTIYLI